MSTRVSRWTSCQKLKVLRSTGSKSSLALECLGGRVGGGRVLADHVDEAAYPRDPLVEEVPHQRHVPAGLEDARHLRQRHVVVEPVEGLRRRPRRRPSGRWPGCPRPSRPWRSPRARVRGARRASPRRARWRRRRGPGRPARESASRCRRRARGPASPRRPSARQRLPGDSPADPGRTPRRRPRTTVTGRRGLGSRWVRRSSGQGYKRGRVQRVSEGPRGSSRPTLHP